MNQIMNYKIIVTLGKEELEDCNNLAIKEADILEIRLDLLDISYLRDKLYTILKELKKPVLFTYRNPKDSSEASNANFSFLDLEKLLQEFNSPENYLDIELDQTKSIFDSIKNCKYTVIYSYHNFSNTISKKEMLDWISKKESLNCIYKFAVSPKNISELETFLEDLSVISKHYKVIGIGMGDIGVYSRLFGDRFGSFATYCCIGKPRAPGQVEIFSLKKVRDEYANIVLPDIGKFINNSYAK